MLLPREIEEAPRWSLAALLTGQPIMPLTVRRRRGEASDCFPLHCRYRSLTGRCLRALRLDMLLLVIHHLGDLPKGRYVCEAAEAQDIEDCIGALQRSALPASSATLAIVVTAVTLCTNRVISEWTLQYTTLYAPFI